MSDKDDEGIDTSDIPEQGPEFFAKARLVMPGEGPTQTQDGEHMTDKMDDVIKDVDEHVIQTTIWHETNADGSIREDHCPGCWNIHVGGDGPGGALVYGVCNECGERRALPLAYPHGQ